MCQGEREMRNTENALVFEQRYFSTGDIKPLLFRLSKIRPFIESKLRIINERVIDIIIIRCRIFLPHN